MSLVELTTVRDCGLSDVRFANAAEHRRKVSREFDIIIRSEKTHCNVGSLDRRGK